MTDILPVLQDRRSIRRYLEKPIAPELLEKVLEAARCTQSWHNCQCWELVLIANPGVREQLQATVPSKNPAYKALVQAPVVVCVCAKTKLSGYFGDKQGSVLGDWYMHDIGLMTQNLCNEAHALGLGTVVVGWLDHAAAQKVIALPDDYQLVSLIPLGHPDHEGKSPKRKELTDFVHRNRFGTPWFEK